MTVPIFILTYRGMEYLNSWFNPEEYASEFTFYILDNGQQNVPERYRNLVIYQTTRNIGCSGGYNLMMDIGFDHFNYDKIVLAQEDGKFTTDQLYHAYNKTQNDIMMGVYTYGFDMAIMGITKLQRDTIGRMDENFVFARCEDVDFIHRAQMVNIFMRNGEFTPHGNVSMVRDMTVDMEMGSNQMYLHTKWGAEPPVYQHPFDDPTQDPKHPPFTDRIKEIYGDITEYPSQTEFKRFCTLRDT